MIEGDEMQRILYVLLGSFVLLLSGVIYAWSILSGPIIQEFEQWSLSQISFAFTICTFMFCIGGFLRGILSSKISARLTLFFSGVMFFVGMLLTAAIQDNLLMIYGGFGVCCGLSVGLTYNTIMSVLAAWFPEKKGMVSGILLMGFGLGSFVIGKMYQTLQSADIMNWRELFGMFGIITGISYLLAGIVIKEPGIQFAGDSFNNKDSYGMSAGEMIANRSFQVYFVWAILLASSGYILLAHANGMLNEAVPLIDAGTAATVVSLISIFNGAGRMLWGISYDKFHYRKTMWLIEIDFALCILSLWLGIKQGNLAFMNLGYITGGLFFAGLAAMNPACISDFFGTKYYPVNFSIINMNVLISSFGSTVAALIYDKTGSFSNVVILLSVVWMMSVVCTFAIKKPQLNEGKTISTETSWI